MSVKTQNPAIKRPKGKGKASAVPVAAAGPPAPESRRWMWAAGFGAALLAAIIVYWPALRGEFVFDDVHMRFYEAHPERYPLRAWIGGARPLTNLSYWVNYQIGGANPVGYHLLNILLHTIAAMLVFLIVRRILEFAEVEVRRRTLVSGFCAALFLLHPVQTEAVAYVAQRSESLSLVLAFAAWACFLYRRSREIRFLSVAAVVLLFGASVGAKEHVAVLPAVILLTDYYWNPGFSFQGIRRNWRLYGVFLAGTLAVARFFYSYLANERTAGFHVQQFTWYEYLFTQCRVLFIYLRLLFLPFGQTADYYVELSHTPLEHGAIFGMAILLAAATAAIVWRKRFPIASYGFFVALVFFLPTSSIVPIRDLAAERRLYLPMIGLLLILAEMLVRAGWNERRLASVMAAIIVVAGILTWQRSFVWSNSMALWSDTVRKSPQKSRAHFGLATAEFAARRYGAAAKEYELAQGPEYDREGLFYSNWALALRGAGRLSEAIRVGRKAVELSPTAATFAHQAIYLAEDGDIQPALELLDRAEKADASYEPLYIERGDILMQTGRSEQACAAFQRAWTLDPNDPSATKGLTTLRCAVAR